MKDKYKMIIILSGIILVLVLSIWQTAKENETQRLLHKNNCKLLNATFTTYTYSNPYVCFREENNEVTYYMIVKINNKMVLKELKQ